MKPYNFRHEPSTVPGQCLITILYNLHVIPKPLFDKLWEKGWPYFMKKHPYD